MGVPSLPSPGERGLYHRVRGFCEAACCGAKDRGVCRLHSVVVLLTVSAMLLGSCVLAAAFAGFPIHLTDALRRQVTIQALPQRIVSLAPSNTERLFAVGAGSTVVGVTTADTYPPEVAAVPKVGGFVPKSISI